MGRLKEVIKDYLDMRFEGVDSWYLDTEELAADITEIVMEEIDEEK